MKLTDIKLILTERDLQLTKSLGQNFLHDSNQIRRIVAAAELEAGDKVLEIGPGLGPLTELLVEKSNHVLAIEKDSRLMNYLRQTYSGKPQLELLCDDGLDYLKKNREWAGWKLVANLPYSVASPILVELASANTPPERMVATLQMEVARRIDAAADTEDYGILTLLIQLRYNSRGWFKIPPTCFFPEPDVDSACITLVKRAQPLLAPELHGAFTKIVKRGFSQRRKMMMKLLKQDWPKEKLEAVFVELGIPLQERAEKVTLEKFALLTQKLAA